MKRRFLSMLFAVIIVVLLVPLDAPKVFADPAVVCKIGTNEYSSLEEALAVVTSGQTITMLDDISYSDGPGFTIDGKTITIDFDGHTISVNTGFYPPTVENLFIVTNSGNLTVKNININYSGWYTSLVVPFTVSGTDSELTLVDVTQADWLDYFLTVDGGTATISGGTFGTSSENIGFNLSNNAVLNITNNPTFNFQNSLIKIGTSSNTDPDTNIANVTIDSGTFNGAYSGAIVRLYGKANVIFNGGTFISTGNTASAIYVEEYGYKSSVVINDLTADSHYIFGSYNNPNVTNFTATINNGHFKYVKGDFALDRNNGLKPIIKIAGGYYGPTESGAPVADNAAFEELNGYCVDGYQVRKLTAADPEKTNGYSYMVELSQPPAPEPWENYLEPLEEMIIEAIESGDTSTIYWDKGDALPNYIMHLFFENPALSLEFKYTYEGVAYEIYIGPGQAVNEDIGWYGPLWLHDRYSKKKIISAIHGVYIIQKGDTLYNLARKFNTSVDALLRLNPNIKDMNLIYPGTPLNY